MKYFLILLALIAIPFDRVVAHDMHHKPVISAEQKFQTRPLSIPDITLTDQNGQSVRLYSDLMKNHITAVSFIFTGCSSTCPLVSQVMRQAQTLLPERMGRDMRMISISVDPQNDTPEQLKKYAQSLTAQRGWSFLTGSAADIARISSAFQARVGQRESHTSTIFVLNNRTGAWTRIDGTSGSSSQLASLLVKASELDMTPDQQASSFFTNLPLITGSGKSVNFYQDVIRDRVIVLNTIFTRCQDACPLITSKLAAVRAQLGKRSAQVQFVSISTDPSFDSPERLQSFAHKMRIDPSWVLLTGKPDNINWVLYKLGLNTDAPSDHSTMILIGNARLAFWQRVAPTATNADILKAIDIAIAGRGS